MIDRWNVRIQIFFWNTSSRNNGDWKTSYKNTSFGTLPPETLATGTLPFGTLVPETLTTKTLAIGTLAFKQ